MESKYGFNKFTISEFEVWVAQLKVARTIKTLQQHHTYIPNYSHFEDDNHFKLQKGMQNHHVHKNGWQDIGQHFTTFPDGSIVTGRSLELSPACIYGFNSHSLCLEHLGNFDTGKDEMTAEQKDTIVRMSAAICLKFSIEINTDKIVYHHWFNLSTGKRNDGGGTNKSCPGTAFFGGNKVEDCEANFLPLVKKAAGKPVNTKPSKKTPKLLKYVAVTASRLNVRSGPGTNHPKVKSRKSAILGSLLRVYEAKDDWYRISGSSQHWVYGSYTIDVKRAVVTATRLNARSGPSTSYQRINAFDKNTELWISELDGGWGKLMFEETWVSTKYLKFAIK